MAAYRILPESWVGVFAMSLPVFEVLLGVWLCSGWRERAAAFCAAGMLGVFLVAVGSAWGRGLAIDCACFGGTGTLGGAVGRDVALLLGALFVYREAWRDSGAS